jgi:uncharacterized protein YndB with AHSA1/START domain
MTARAYKPGPADARVQREPGENWTLVLTRELRHPPEIVWEALTDPAQLREWAPYDADRNLGAAGETVKLTTFGAPGPHVVETKIRKADRPRSLEFNWGGGDLRWELSPNKGGTRLTLWAQINRRYIAMGAAGWHVCLDVLGFLLDGNPVGRHAGPETMQFEGWQRLNGEYTKLFAEKTS